MIIEYIKRISSFKIWSFLGTMLALVSLFYYFTDKYFNLKELTLTIKSQTNLVKIQNIDLNIMVTSKGVPLNNEGNSVFFIRFELQNTGSDVILQSYYDALKPFTIKCNNGLVKFPKIVNSNSQYIRESVPINLDYDDEKCEIYFPKFIIEPGESFTAELFLVTDKESVEINFELASRIAGTKFIFNKNENRNSNFLDTALSGDPVIQVIRFFIYGIIFIIFGLASIFISIFINEFKDKYDIKKRKRQVKDLQEERIIENIWLLTSYINFGLKPLLEFNQQLNDNEVLMKQLEFRSNKRMYTIASSDKIGNISIDKIEEADKDLFQLLSMTNRNTLLDEAIDRKLINFSNKNVNINTDLFEEVKYLISNLK